VEKQKGKRFKVRIRKDLYRTLQEIARQEGTSVETLIGEALDLFLSQKLRTFENAKGKFNIKEEFNEKLN
jgi:predicted DNA-binding ribbon-helix-helix protein